MNVKNLTSSIARNHSQLDQSRSGSAKYRILKLAQVLSCTLLAASMGYAQKDDFDDGNDTGWAPYNPIGVGTYTFPSGGYRIQTIPSPDPVNFGPGRAGSVRDDVSYSDFFITVDVVDFDPDLDQSIGLMARLDDIGAGMTDGYAMTYQTEGGDIDITWFINENPNPPLGGDEVPTQGNDAFTMVRGRTYRFQFIGAGSTLTARVYELPNLTEPVMEITGTDTHYTSGVNGLLNFSDSNARTDATYDNYLALEAEPPKLTIEYNIFQDLWVLWPIKATGFVLQSTPSLTDDPIVWTDICPPYDVFGDNYLHSANSEVNGTLFYRLEKKVCVP